MVMEIVVGMVVVVDHSMAPQGRNEIGQIWSKGHVGEGEEVILGKLTRCNSVKSSLLFPMTLRTNLHSLVLYTRFSMTKSLLTLLSLDSYYNFTLNMKLQKLYVVPYTPNLLNASDFLQSGVYFLLLPSL